jgi:hypothetical protein
MNVLHYCSERIANNIHKPAVTTVILFHDAQARVRTSPIRGSTPSVCRFDHPHDRNVEEVDEETWLNELTSISPEFLASPVI